jgi:hypothetical protein
VATWSGRPGAAQSKGVAKWHEKFRFPAPQHILNYWSIHKEIRQMWVFEEHEVILGPASAITCLWRRNIQLCHWAHRAVWCIKICPYPHSNSHVLKQQLSRLVKFLPVQLCNVAHWQKTHAWKARTIWLVLPQEWDKMIISSISVKKCLMGNWHVKPLSIGCTYNILKVLPIDQCFSH